MVSTHSTTHESAALQLVGLATLAQQIRALGDLAAHQTTNEAETTAYAIQQEMALAVVNAFPSVVAVQDSLL
jgi:hypothetical protein